MRNDMIGVPVGPGESLAIAFDPELTVAIILPVNGKSLLRRENPCLIQRLDVRTGKEEALLDKFETRTDRFFAVSRLARKTAILDQLGIALFFIQRFILATFGFERDEPLRERRFRACMRKPSDQC